MPTSSRIPSMILAGAIVAWMGEAAFLPTQSTAQAESASVQTVRTATIHWSQVPLTDALQRLDDQFGADVFLDRRVDPAQRISLEAQNCTEEDALARTAAAVGLGVSRLGVVTYVGPTSTTDQLRSLAVLRSEEVAQLPVRERTPLIRRRPLDWPRLTEPRSLIASAVTQRGWQVAGVELLPHDLWRAGSLPELNLAEQLTVLLAGFDLTFRLHPSRRTVEIVPLAGPITLTRRYRLRYAESESARLREQFPDLRARLDGDWLTVEARLEDHERLAEWLNGPPRAVQTNSWRPQPVRRGGQQTQQVFSLHVEDKPVQAVLDYLVERLKWTLDVDEASIRAAGLSLQHRVSIEVENADQEELLQAVLRPAGLDFRREGKRLRIVPREGGRE